MKLRTKLPMAASAAAASAIAWLALGEAPGDGGTAGAGGIQHVILITVDGLRGDLLKALMDGTPAAYPHFNRLRNEGASTFEARCDYNYSETLPDHLSIITSRPVLQPAGAPNTAHHGFSSNNGMSGQTLHNAGNPNVPYKHSIFDVAHDNGLVTAFFHSKDRVSFIESSFNAASGAADTTGEDNGKDKIDFASVGVSGSTTSASAMGHLMTHLESNPLPGFTLLHLVDPDKTGHSQSWGTAAWNGAVASTDTAIGTLLAWLDAHPAEKAVTAIILTADHGGGTPSNHHQSSAAQTNYTIPVFLWGPCFAGGTSAYSHFINRASPGTTRPAEDAATLQPLRNGDSANIAAGLLGFGTVPGSWFQPVLMDPEEQKQLLTVQPDGAGARVTWPAAATAYRLETATDPGQSWTAVTNGITEEGASMLYVSHEPGGQRFFRLRRD